MKKLLYALAGTALIAFSACNMNYKTTKSGMKYKIFTAKATGADTLGLAVHAGDIAKFEFKYTLPENKDSVLRDSYSQMPVFGKVDTSAMSEMTIMEIIPMMKTGDSAEVLISCDSIIAKSPAGQSAPFLKKGQHIKAVVSLLNVFKDEATAKADAQKEQEKAQLRDAGKLKEAGLQLDKYIADKGIKAVKTKNGVYIVLDKPGDISLKADSGMEASINYTGSLLDGTKFDSNTDSTFNHKEPIQVEVGAHRTIEGWDEALPYFGKGAKGKIYVPAALAYGSRPAGEKIKPFSNLVFDIEVLDVKKASAAPEQPQQKMTPEMQKQLQEQIQKQMQAQKGQGH